MQFVITGGAGFIGSHIADALVLRGDEVVIIDDLSSGRMQNIGQMLARDNVTFIEGSITDPAVLRSAFKGADGVFHQAALASVPKSIADPARNHEVNVTGTFNVLLAARDAGAGKVVCASSAAIYGNRPGLPKREEMAPDPLSPYAAAKLMDEYYASVFSRLYGVETVCLRYFNVYGPRQDPASDYAAVIPRFISKLMAGEVPVIYGDGGQTRDFVFVRDVVRANMLAMESDATGVFNVAGGREISVNELAKVLMDIFRELGSPSYEPAREGDVYQSFADVSKARAAFGFEAGVFLEQGLRETVEGFTGE